MAGFCVGKRIFISLLSNKHCHNNGKDLARNIISSAKYSMSSVTSKKQPSLVYMSLVGVSAGALLGGGYSYYSSYKAKQFVPNEGSGSAAPIIKEFPDVNISRRIFNATDTSGLQLTLFQYPTCPFCCKVRAFLNYHGISYNVVEVNPVLRQQIKWTDYRKVPIVLAKVDDGFQQLNDSTMIISALSTYLSESHPNLTEIVNCYPSMSYRDSDGSVKSEIMNRYFLMFKEQKPMNRTKEEMEEERKWRQWADNVLVHTLSPNVYRTQEEALQAFQWFSEVGEWDRLFPSWERNLIVYVGAFAMLFIGKRLKKRHSLKEDVRQSLYDECNVWMKAIKKKNSTFMGGDKPNLADLAVFGVLSSIEGCTAFQDLLSNTGLGAWYWPMKDTVQAHTGTVISIS